MVRRSRSLTVLTCVVAVGWLLTGCSGLGPDTSGAERVATQFLAAVAAQDGPTACGLLAPDAQAALAGASGGTCEEAVVAPDVAAALGTGAPVEPTQAFGREAQVRFAGDVLFLALDGREWVVTAAGCTARVDHPYDCVIEGS